MNASSIPPDTHDNWLALLIAIIEQAHRDTNKPTIPEPIKQEATALLAWARKLEEDRVGD